MCEAAGLEEDADDAGCEVAEAKSGAAEMKRPGFLCRICRRGRTFTRADVQGVAFQLRAGEARPDLLRTGLGEM
ncbi:MAG TPA: hypothetical protein DEG43_07480 [Acidimicrobiaceae bacterium]|nr:hypothetical protein [Acidimicrobiaceae bacterium]